ncbi:MAG: hypothetical protein COW00_06020 [Bdellovibrio sp. CG12_big_fil_rev_8_21_14_0_65_39_13]|nr:MAG: hypothetical protein COW78_18555 [Bdellovibrio sp. CG22_combo_CG10-13_8_21_14_all_39_27]PIQ60785.1 MAG: hypothetical protein COW00_06020 [Bdellovibrio sp. CG12_big_fil_rev_8_21_14_0_65_39_13]PIR36408.1 MAG: hypothetical protein COV37_03360 [Bdellovibrio sp. CG11_big_fil_rev_8_21_14_0_20_39_38]
MKYIISLFIALAFFSTPASSKEQHKLEIRPVKKALLELEDIESAQFVQTKDNKGALSITLRPEGTKRLADYTASNLHEDLALIIDGKVTSMRKVQAPIRDGKIWLTPYDKQEARKIIEMIK